MCELINDPTTEPHATIEPNTTTIESKTIKINVTTKKQVDAPKLDDTENEFSVSNSGDSFQVTITNLKPCEPECNGDHENTFRNEIKKSYENGQTDNISATQNVQPNMAMNTTNQIPNLQNEQASDENALKTEEVKKQHEPDTSYKRYFKQVGIQVASTSFAGLVEICVMQPLDVLKVRLQTQSSDPHLRYRGLVDAVRTLYTEESFAVFYKGIVPPLLMEIPKRTLKTYVLAGAAAGITDSIITNPFEVVKVSLQTEKSKIGTFAMTKQIIQEGGWGMHGIQKGLSAIIFRNAILTSSYFGIYNVLIRYTKPINNPSKEFGRKFGVGFIASAIGTILNTPFDVIKSKIQGKQPNPPEIKYETLFQSIKLVYEEESLMGFYRGFIPRIVRLGTGGAIMMLIYEEVSQTLHKHLLQKKN